MLCVVVEQLVKCGSRATIGFWGVCMHPFLEWVWSCTLGLDVFLRWSSGSLSRSRWALIQKGTGDDDAMNLVRTWKRGLEMGMSENQQPDSLNLSRERYLVICLPVRACTMFRTPEVPLNVRHTRTLWGWTIPVWACPALYLSPKVRVSYTILDLFENMHKLPLFRG